MVSENLDWTVQSLADGRHQPRRAHRVIVGGIGRRHIRRDCRRTRELEKVRVGCFAVFLYRDRAGEGGCVVCSPAHGARG